MIPYERNLFGQPIVTTLVADPPWLFSDDLPGDGRGAAKHYPCMSLGDLYAFRTTFDFELAADAFLLLWRVAAMQREALDLAAAWGFEVKAELVWLKRYPSGERFMGMGHYSRGEHETCLIATRGAPKMLRRDLRSTFEGPVRRHSQKPEEFYQIIDTAFPAPRAELFARRRRDGWFQFGNELPALAAG